MPTAIPSTLTARRFADMDSYDVVIVGAGHAGVQAAVSLVQGGFEGRVALLSAESCLPYERPPLCKSYLDGEVEVDEIGLRAPAYWNESPVDLLLGHRVVGVDPVAHRVTTADGGTIGYSSLVWAAGGSARTLTVPGHDLDNVFSIRDVGDVDALKKRIATAADAVIVGGGYIGLETAAGLRKAGIGTVVVEMQNRLLARVTSPTISAFIEQVHRDNGVEVVLERGVVEITGRDGQAEGVRLTDGTSVPADLVIVGVGLAPNVEPITAAGGLVSDGIVVDTSCRTTLPDVFAIGDVARHPNRFARGEVRLESVQNAVDQAKVAAACILGRGASYDAVPWFWSNQYDVKLKTAGLLTGYDTEAVRGDPLRKKFSVGYFLDDTLIAVDSVNNPGDYLAARQLLERGITVSREVFADHTTSLKTLLAHQPVE
ncbi:NAD(P)/FAD-dependent oxidoreductase [Actinomycetes bacterium M1A6_2h]